MWKDSETNVDFLNFQSVATTAADIIRDNGIEPLSIGISGSWGIGKSSLVKMIYGHLAEEDTANQKYVFLEFNAWLYQGFDDAKFALIQAVADKLYEESERRKSVGKKVLEFIKQVRWIRLARLAAPTAAGLIAGGALAGPLGALVGAVSGALGSGKIPSAESVQKLNEAYDALEPSLKGLLTDSKSGSMPKEISALRSLFTEALKELDCRLIVLVDDLDRCLPDTAISTLEAMRLLLFMPRTAFVIAADEAMIRSAVRTHFGSGDISENLVTSYFDKLIQVPLLVPRPGVNEIKVYLALLFSESTLGKGQITTEQHEKAKALLRTKLHESWRGPIRKADLEAAFVDLPIMADKLTIVHQIAPLLVTSDHIAGNPRLIKRFLNNLVMREAIAKSLGMALDFAVLVKMQLFERCASSTAQAFMNSQILESGTGSPKFIGELEYWLAHGKEHELPAQLTSSAAFVTEWLKSEPVLKGIDLRPFIYLSRASTSSFAAYDELSEKGRVLLETLVESDKRVTELVRRVKELDEKEAATILQRLITRIRTEQWSPRSFLRCFNVIGAFPGLGVLFVDILNEVPPNKRPAAIIPFIKDLAWAQNIMNGWAEDSSTPKPVVNAINGLKKEA